MSSRNRDKGKELERFTKQVFDNHGIESWRPRDGYPIDIGDVLLDQFKLTLQCKWINNLANGVAQALDGAVVQSLNASEQQPGGYIWSGAGVVHRNQRPMNDSIVVFTLPEFAEFLNTVEPIR
jgi:hypothetical protein